MSETTVTASEHTLGCRIVHLTVRVLLAINVLIFATSLSTRISRLFMSSELAIPLVRLALISSFILPLVTILEAIVLHRNAAYGRSAAVADIVLTSSWAVVMVGIIFFELTHFAVL